MSKLKIDLVSESAANPYLSEDGLLNFSKIERLQARVAKTIKAQEKTEEPAKILNVYVMRRRAKPVQYRASSDQKGDLKYRAARATKIAVRKRVKPEALARVAIVLQVIDNDKLKAEFKLAESALKQHIRKTAGVLNKVSKEKGKERDARNKEFDKAIAAFKKVLVDGGLSEKAIVESQGMMGKTVLVRVTPDLFVAINPADKSRFSAAVKASKQAA